MSKTSKSHPVLENLFNSRVRVKVLRFLFRSYPINIGVKDLAKRIQESSEVVKKEMGELSKIGVVKKI